MIGTIRKHSGWLWAVIITATIISFVYWGVGNSRMNNGSGGTGGNFGMVYGKKITSDMYDAAERNFYVSYWFHSGNWPDKATVKQSDIDQQVYLSIMFAQKEQQLGIHVSEDAVATSASARLAALGRNGQAVPLDALVTQVLAPRGFGAVDFEKYVKNELMIQQLIQVLGLSGALVTPQEATAAYQHDHEELQTAVVFFTDTNYFASLKMTPAIVGQFYTNYQAEYRLPDRVQINYAAFDATNYMARAKSELTNLNELVESYYQKVGENYRGSKSPAEARAKITEEALESRALVDAKKDADDFATAVFAINPTAVENLSAVAKQRGVSLHQTAPFAKDTGPDELDSAANFTKAAFDLTSDIPVAGPVQDGNAVYVIALARTLPSMIPSFAEIRSRVAMDYQQREATLMAQQSGSAFYHMLTNQLSAGHSFASTCASTGHQPQILPPFSISTQELPEIGELASLNQVKQAAFTTAPGKISNFEPTSDGGFILFVQSRLPVDPTKMAADMPEFTKSMRQARQNEAFAQWYQGEAAAVLQLPKQ